MKLLAGIFILLFAAVFYTGCSSTAETGQKDESAVKKDSLYVFDEVPVDTSSKNMEITPIPAKEPVSEPQIKSTVYYVQIGAFSTAEKANEFEAMAKKKLKKDFKVFFNSQTQLHVVQVMPGFSVKKDAETYRDELWKMKDYKDAWIVTEPK